MQNPSVVRINFKGGLISPHVLKTCIETLNKCDIKKVKFGLRQQLIFIAENNIAQKIKANLKSENINCQTDSNSYPNIVSSYASEEIFQQTNWCSEGIYKDILDGFSFEPKLKINISDYNQSISPYFSGHFNFIAADEVNYWYLTLRLPKTNEVFNYKRLIYTTEIPKICRLLEALYGENLLTAEELFEAIPHDTIQTAIKKPLSLHAFRLPYYEGLNRYGSKSWLGVYRRDEYFDTAFLMDVCNLCLQTKIGQICITPWKSLIIKGIADINRPLWSNILTSHSISIRHAASELNWQIEDHAPAALELKKKLMEQFTHWDLRTFGICFGIKTKPKTEVFASIMITKRARKFLPFSYVYDISYTKDFDPNGRTKIYLAKSIAEWNLAEQMRRAIVLYNRMRSENTIEIAAVETNTEKPRTIAFQCTACLSVYDGEEPFEKVPEAYCCTVCESPKSMFKKVVFEDLIV